MHKTRFHVAAMDCPAEVQLIRAALPKSLGVERIEVDLVERDLSVWHSTEAERILQKLKALKLGASLVSSEVSSEDEAHLGQDHDQTRVLRLLLAINATMFVIELVAGWMWQSTSLLSDSLDMFADATVYGMTLLAVGASEARQQRAARLSGWLEMALACGVLLEVLRSAISGSTPDGIMMMATASLALVANVSSVVLLAGHRTKGVHMQASWIFSTNDVIANLGVIIAGAIVFWTSSAIADLVMGTLIGLLVMRGAFRILAISRAPASADAPRGTESPPSPDTPNTEP